MSAADVPLKTYPDIPKLTGMGKRMVHVSRMLSRGSETPIVTPVKEWANATVDAILQLQAELKQAGMYRFVVFDEGGPDKVEWAVRIGGETETVMPTSSGANGASAFGDGTTRDIGNGYKYDAAVGLLTTPRGVFRWNPGEDLPIELRPSATTMSTSLPPGANVGWGALPAHGGEDPRVKALEDQIRAQTEQRREDERRREMTEMQSNFTKMIEAQNARTEALIAKLTERPSGPSESEQRMARELEQLKLQTETRAREDQMRAEMRALQDRTEALVRSLSESRPDPQAPMLALLGQIISSQQTAASVQAEASKENMRVIAERLSSSTMTPERMVEMIKLAKDQSASGEVMKNALEMYKNLFGMSQDVLRQMAELSSAGSEPAWVGVLQSMAGQIGRVAESYNAKKEAEAAAAAAVAASRRQVRVHTPPAPPVRQQVAAAPAAPPAAPQPPAPPARPAPAAGPKTAAQVRDAAAQQVFGAAANANGNGASTNGAPTNGAAAAPPAAAPPAKRQRRKAAAPKTSAEIPQEELAALVAAMSDDEFFGVFMSAVNDMRTAVTNGAPLDVLADEILAAPMKAQQAGIDIRTIRAVELLANGRVDIVIDRLLPGASDDYRKRLTDTINRKREAYEAGASDDGAGDDGGEEEQPALS